MTDIEIFGAALVGFGWIGIFFLMAIAVVKAANKASASRAADPNVKFWIKFKDEDPVVVKEWPHLTFVVRISDDEGDEDPAWIGHCLETDSVSQADSPEEALELVMQSASIQIEMEKRQGDDPFSHPAPKEYWPQNMRDEK